MKSVESYPLVSAKSHFNESSMTLQDARSISLKYIDHLHVTTFAFERADHIIRSTIGLREIFRRRPWAVLSSENTKFICSDHPVTKYWRKRPLISFTRKQQNPTYWNRSADIIIPISSHRALVSTYNTIVPHQYITPRQVTMINTYLIMSSWQHLYFSGDDFQWLQHDGTTGGIEQVIHHAKMEKATYNPWITRKAKQTRDSVAVAD